MSDIIAYAHIHTAARLDLQLDQLFEVMNSYLTETMDEDPKLVKQEFQSLKVRLRPRPYGSIMTL